jgi:hypothetical protein
MHILVNPARREPVTGKECFCIDWYLQRRHDNLENSLVIDAIFFKREIAIGFKSCNGER